jgi:hypothetical protein
MTIRAPFPQLAKTTTNASGAGTTTVWGTTITNVGTANTLTAWNSLGATPAFGSYGLILNLNGLGASTINSCAMVELGIGPNSGAVTTIAEKLFCSQAGATGSGTGMLGGRTWVLPLFIPPNTTLWARYQTRSTSRPLNVHVSYQGGHGAGLPVCQQIVALGASPATTVGTTVVPGATGAEGAWTQIVASTAINYMGFLVAGSLDNTVMTNVGYCMDIGVGAAASEVSIGENVHWWAGNTSEWTVGYSFPVFARVRAGQRLVVRASCNGTPDTTFSAIIYGMVA